MAKKTETVKMNIYGYTTILVIVLAIIGSYFLIKPTEKQAIISDFNTNLLTYEHVFDEVSYNEFKKAIKLNENTYIYFGCPEDDFRIEQTQQEKENNEPADPLMIEMINTNAKIMDIEKILYLNSSKLSEGQRSELRDYLVDFELNDDNSIPTLDLWIFKNDTLRNAYSKYSESGLSDTYIARLIFQYNME